MPKTAELAASYIDKAKIALHKLPESIGQLTSLNHLIIKNTAIHSLPDALGDLSNLEYLEIGRNINLHDLPHTIGKLHQLTELNLEGGYLK